MAVLEWSRALTYVMSMDWFSQSIKRTYCTELAEKISIFRHCVSTEHILSKCRTWILNSNMTQLLCLESVLRPKTVLVETYCATYHCRRCQRWRRYGAGSHCASCLCRQRSHQTNRRGDTYMGWLSHRTTQSRSAERERKKEMRQIGCVRDIDKDRELNRKEIK